MELDPSPSQRIVIIGAGIIGSTTAYYLTRHPAYNLSNTTITILEASRAGPAQGASGKAGGLIAKWAYPRELVDVSFAEHVRLAEEYNGAERWGWRYVGVGSWEGRGDQLSREGQSANGSKVGERRSLEKTTGLDESWRSAERQKKGLPDDLTWVKEDLTDAYSPMAPAGSTAQVHPYQFTTSMLELAMERGAALVAGRAITIERAESGRVTGVVYATRAADGSEGPKVTIPATHVVLAAGAWSSQLLPTLPITGTRAHSITIRTAPGVEIAPYALFTEIHFPSASTRSKIVSPEIYARPGGELYACGTGDKPRLPATVDEVECDPVACENIWEHVRSISQELRDGVVEKHQACILPVVSTGGGPIVGEATKVAKGLIVATGHTCWGICNAPGTGKAVSELIMEGAIKCANLRMLEHML